MTLNAARFKWVAIMLACFLFCTALGSFRSTTVRETLASARVYWNADRAYITITSTEEFYSEGALVHIFRLAQQKAHLGEVRPDIRIGPARIYQLQNGAWSQNAIPPFLAPMDMPLWPFNGTFYSWDNLRILRRVTPSGSLASTFDSALAQDLFRAFPNDPANYFPAGAGPSPLPYDVVQDVITREEWHAYSNVQKLTPGKTLAFSSGGHNFEITTERGSRPSDVTLNLRNNGKLTTLWQAHPEPRTASNKMALSSLGGRILQPGYNRFGERSGFMPLITPLIVLLLVWGIFLKPAIMQTAPDTVEFVPTTTAECPELDQARWNDLNQQLRALGFVPLGDYKLKNLFAYKSINRMFVHPQQNCYASLFQLFAPQAPRQLVVWISSYLGEDWSLGHGGSKPTSGGVILRSPHKIGFSRPDAPVERIFREHLLARNKISQDLGLAVAKVKGIEMYFERSNREAVARRATLKRQNGIAMAVRVIGARIVRPSYDWLGDYPRELQLRTGQRITARQFKEEIDQQLEAETGSTSVLPTPPAL